MLSEFEQKLEKYAEVILKVGLNLQPKQRLLIRGPAQSGISFENAPLVRIIAKKAYQMGARLVDVVWGDEQMMLIRYQYGNKRFLKEFPKWRIDASFDIIKAGDALLNITNPNPDLLKDVDMSLILRFQLYLLKHTEPFSKLISNFGSNWLIVSTPNKAWADKIFPELPSDDRIPKLWEVVFKACRINEENPILMWKNHIESLFQRRNYLNQKQYKTLKLKAPGTDLTIGLPKDHIWNGGSETSLNGIDFAPNIPTEEIFTTPHKDRVNGVVMTTRPVAYEGQVIKQASLKFSNGRVVEVKAKSGEKALQATMDVDEGARRLGEIALVPNSSPISKVGVLFYNILFDENASNHIALGRGFRLSLKNGDSMTDEEFAASGGNQSLIHIDFMIGSGEMDVDGILEDGTIDPIMRKGEWAFEV